MYYRYIYIYEPTRNHKTGINGRNEPKKRREQFKNRDQAKKKGRIIRESIRMLRAVKRGGKENLGLANIRE